MTDEMPSRPQNVVKPSYPSYRTSLCCRQGSLPPWGHYDTLQCPAGHLLLSRSIERQLR